ncbi:MarR family transcriptional regulator [Streptomyces sp. MBT65]|uniref:MarR family transcriptional regulator n=1 Tax=Streptomyces sp. MBT65 TaxID=1488395 RepID=UPI00190DC974|nr:MarR family transcriptional regulator [Streptomyces sp. MBT65]MBK3579971.1 MarR family transcriptional regulator [Streptomyces sp. MBT65]
MAGIRDSLGRAGHDLLAHSLAACGREEFTGGLRVSGSPGGIFHLRGGLVVAVESPGAPGPEALLLRSGRIGGEQWADLVRESGGSRWPLDGLIAHGYAGAAQLRIVCVLALHDAAFAVVAGDVDDCELAPDERPFAPVTLGEPSVRLLQDAARKFAAITALPYPVRPDRERPRPPAYALDEAGLGLLQRELLAHADGRRTARDLAFRTGRAVYTVTAEVARMLAEGLLECADTPVPIPVRVPPGGLAVARREPAPAPAPAQFTAPTALPRRNPGASGITETLVPEKSGAGWKGFFRMRNGTSK